MKFDERIEERFVENIDFDFQIECWTWIGTINNGYGVFWNGHKQVLAHRFAYQLWVDEIEGDNTIDHLCANRACVSPFHLEQCSRAENSLRMIHRGAPAFQAAKTHCKRGHLYDEKNTYIGASGSRWCRECDRLRSAKRDTREYHRKYYIERKRRAQKTVHRKAGKTEGG